VNCRALRFVARLNFNCNCTVNALRRDRPVRRLLPHIIQLEIAIVQPKPWPDDPRDEVPLLRIPPPSLNRRDRAVPARRPFSRCVRGRRASPARRDMSFSTASGSTDRASTVRTITKHYECRRTCAREFVRTRVHGESAYRMNVSRARHVDRRSRRSASRRCRDVE